MLYGRDASTDVRTTCVAMLRFALELERDYPI